MVIRDKVGMGPLEPLISDPWIEDISCSGLGPVYIEHKIFGGLKSSINFDTHEELDDFVLKLAEKMKKPVTFRNPIVDATLPDGSRINIVYGGDVSKNGSNFTIRKFMGLPLSIVDICNSGAMTWQMAGYMSLIVEEGMNFFVSGETASGKTTLMNALMTFIRPDAKIVSIEDTPEVQVPHPNWTREVVRGQMSQGGGSVDMFSLLKAALRQRPNEIIIGEIRGEEGNIAFQAMMTGHAVCATFHAATVEKLIQRVTGAPISVPRTYVENLNVVVICSAVRLPNGKMGRRILSISEIIGYDPASGSFSFVEIFRWDPVKDVFEFVGLNNSYLLEQRIAPSRGLSEKKRRQIYKEVDRRGALLQKLERVRRHQLLRALQALVEGPEAGAVLGAQHLERGLYLAQVLPHVPEARAGEQPPDRHVVHVVHFREVAWRLVLRQSHAVRSRIRHGVKGRLCERFEYGVRRVHHRLGVGKHPLAGHRPSHSVRFFGAHTERRERRVHAGNRPKLRAAPQLGQTAHPGMERPVLHRRHMPRHEGDRVQTRVRARVPLVRRDALDRLGEASMRRTDLLAKKSDGVHAVDSNARRRVWHPGSFDACSHPLRVPLTRPIL